MKRYLLIAAALPLAALAQPINVINNPNQPGYVNPSQQRLQTQMQSQQLQQKGMLNQQIQTQSRLQQQQLQTQMNNNVERIQQNQPGMLNPQREQVLPNTNGGMLNRSSGSSQHMLNSNGATLNSTQQTHMIEPRQNGDMLRQNGTTLNTQGSVAP
ncbi:DUF2756 family protein [Cronobacter malonaticus]|uniref:DUF2756 domain-containing protein n=1 Tax=Cronobacter malonaticus TaxID=413503 RepID=V5TVB3_9ENTR|nr:MULTISPECIES: DUF2756 family protein [Cronobacter]CCJ94497.1 FIG00554505: hypothetical protein [Cronobacter malonaticus 681]AHB68605.1 hypothetical protein P262_00346 [Cronobacter malonaticus]ALX76895.1 hypothetical protein AFK66_001205 [Cronobacter malonaticus LMG 23826]EGT4279815.1 DUF2756 family protein [Cronobacter malonaticus]EGT4289508.1 DUF2756 family protein [Cronobacter malonaticus]